jgi:hypothetical protein
MDGYCNLNCYRLDPRVGNGLTIDNAISELIVPEERTSSSSVCCSDEAVQPHLNLQTSDVAP